MDNIEYSHISHPKMSLSQSPRGMRRRRKVHRVTGRERERERERERKGERNKRG